MLQYVLILVSYQQDTAFYVFLILYLFSLHYWVQQQAFFVEFQKNLFVEKVLPMSSEQTVTHVPGI